MSATTAPAVTLVWAVKRGLVETWRVLPLAIVAGLIGTAATAPLVIAALAGAPGWMLAATVLPPALAATSLAAVAARVLRGESVPFSVLGRVDPVLSVLLACTVVVAGTLLTSPGPVQLAGAVLAAVVAMVTLPALAYGAVRGRAGLTALRGGFILALLRPGWALSLAAFAVLAGFAVAASAGVLALVAGPFLLGIATSLVAALLDEIDHQQGDAA